MKIRRNTNSNFFRSASMTVLMAAALVLQPLATPPLASALADAVGINEIMPDPVEIGDAAGEWVELKNSGSEVVDISGWTIAGGTVPAEQSIAAGALYVLCATNQATTECDGVSTSLNVPNDGDRTLTLANTAGETVDEFSYSGSEQGESIEVVKENGTSTGVNNSTDNYLTNQGVDSNSDNTGTPGAENRAQPSAAATNACNGSTFDNFTLGSVNGQSGWSATGAKYDQSVVENETTHPASLGCKSLRFSNATVSGSYADQVISNQTTNEAGETSAENGDKSGGDRKNQFIGEWSFASVTPNTYQPNLQITVSPDRGDGARMSWINMSDNADGLAVKFYDYQNGEFVLTTVASGLDRTKVYTIKVVMNFVDGEQNDVVEVYVNGTLAHTGTSWEDYFREGEGKPTRTVDSLMFRASGTPALASEGEGFLFDNVSVATQDAPEEDNDKPVLGFESYEDPTGQKTRIVVTIDDESEIDMRKGVTHFRYMNGENLVGNAKGSSGSYALNPLGGNRYEAIVDTRDFVPKGSEGDYRVYLRAQDVNGNENAISAAKSNNVNIDNRGPRIENVQTSENPVRGEVEVRFTLEDSHDVDLSKGETHVRFSHGSELTGGAAAKSSNTAVTFDEETGEYVATIDTNEFADGGSGKYWVYIRAADEFGNATGDDDVRGIVIDNAKPTVSVNIQDGERVTGDEPLTVTVQEAGVGLKRVTAVIENSDGEPLRPTCTQTPTGQTAYTLVCDLSGLADGTYRVVGHATDLLDNRTNLTPFAFTVGPGEEETEAETGTETNPGNNENEEGVDQPQVLGDGTDTSNVSNDDDEPVSVQSLLGSTTGNTILNPAVLGLADDSIASDEEEEKSTEDVAVLGEEDDVTSATTDGDEETDEGCWDIFGLCWYWWVAIVLAILVTWYVIRSVRRRDDDVV